MAPMHAEMGGRSEEKGYPQRTDPTAPPPYQYYTKPFNY